jgi:hypothetical protein
MVEVLVSLAVVGVLAVPTAGVFTTATGASVAASHRDVAVALATGDLAKVRSLPYGSIGFYADQQGYVASYDSMPTVELGSTTPAGYTPPIEPVATTVVGAISYRIDTYVVWASTTAAVGSSGQAYQDAYKEAVAVVTWVDGVGSEQVTESTLIASGALGACSDPSDCSSTQASSAALLGVPQLAAPQLPAAPNDESEVELTWSIVSGCAGSFVVQWSTVAGSWQFSSTPIAVTSCPSGATWSYTATNLAAGTTYVFRVVAWSTDGSQSVASNTESATTATSSSTTCSLGALSVAGASSGSTTKTYLSQSGTMSENLVLSLTTSGSCNDTTFAVEGLPPGGSGQDPGSPWTLPLSSGGQFEGTVYSQGESGWAIGTHTFVAGEIVGGSFSPASPPVEQTFLVCAYTTSPSSSPSQC